MNFLRSALTVLFFACSGSIAASASTNVFYSADTFAGADASIKINACIKAVIAAGGGTCDASGLGGSQGMSQQVNVGSATSGTSNIGVSLLLPDTANWEWYLTDSTKCGIFQYSSTSIVGNQPGGGGNRMVLLARHGSTMDSIYCTAPTGMNYVRAEGFSVINNAPSTFANGVIHIRSVDDQSSFTRISAANYYGDAWHVESACCGTRFSNIHAASNGNIPNGSGGGTPLTIGPGKVDGVGFYDVTVNEPGYGFHEIVFKGEALVRGVNFYNLYMEGNGGIDNTTSMVYIGPYTGPVHFFGGLANTEQTSMSTSKPVFEAHGFLLDVSSFETANAQLGIADYTANKRVAVWNFNGNLGNIPAYTTAH